MKRILLLMSIGLGLMTSLQLRSVSEAARTLEDYPLVCRGGGSLVTGIAPGERNIGFTFVRGTKPAGEGLAPGECSWKDRGMYPNEPDRVSQHVEESSDSLRVGGTLALENRWYEELHSSDKYWTFMVSNNGKGQLIATSARPNKTMDLSPTARVPSKTGQILRPNLPSARTPDDETPTVVPLRGQAERPRTEAMKGLPGGRELSIPLGARLMSTAADVDAGPLYGSGLVMWPSTYVDRGHPPLGVDLYFNTKGIYFITFAVTDTSNPECLPKEECNGFSIELPDHSNHAFRAKGFAGRFMVPPFKLQYLTTIIHADTAGWYSLAVSYEARVSKLEYWHFWSCDVTTLK